MTLYEQTKAAADAYIEKFARNWKGHEMDPVTVTKVAVKGTERVAFIKGVEWERQRDKWISVVDELPPEKQEVLAITKEPLFIRQAKWDQGTDDTKEWFASAFTHWQPLPEPPKTDNRNKDEF